MFLHLAVGKRHICLRYQRLDSGCGFCDGLHPVVDIIYLSFPGQFPVNGCPHHFLVIFTDIGLNGHTVHRRFFQHTHIPDSRKAHVKGTGNGRRRQSQHINVGTELLDLLLICYAKPLFLVDNQKSQILVFHIFGKHPVGSDDNVHQSFFQIFNGLLLLGRCTETAEKIHPHRKFFHALHKGIIVLLGQNRRRHQIHYLTAFLYGFECGPDGHLGLSVTYIAAD